MQGLLYWVAALVLGCVCGIAAAADVGAVVMHGKWGSPDPYSGGLAAALVEQVTSG